MTEPGPIYKTDPPDFIIMQDPAGIVLQWSEYCPKFVSNQITKTGHWGIYLFCPVIQPCHPIVSYFLVILLPSFLPSFLLFHLLSVILPS